MDNRKPRRRYSNIFLILGLVFLGVGLATDQSAFSWLAIVFVILSLATGAKWLRRRP